MLRCHWSRDFNNLALLLVESWVMSFLPQTKSPMHLHCPTSSASAFWYPTLFGSVQVSHKMLRNLNGPYASSRRFNHSNSTSICLVFPNLSEIVMDNVWVRWVTFGTILTQVSLSSTCVASAMFCFSWLRIILETLHLLHFKLRFWIWLFFALVGVRLGILCTNRSNRLGLPV